MKRNYLFLSLGILFLVLEFSPALSQQLAFHKVSPPEGKIFEHVTGIAQDGHGYMWFATKRGLFRYDGYELISYKNDPLNSNSLASDALEAISIDKSGIIWLGTSANGLERFDPANGIFSHFRSDKSFQTISSDLVRAVFVDRNGILWLGTTEGLDAYDINTGKFKHYRHLTKDTTSISSNEVISIYEDKQGTLWIGTGSVYSDDKDKTAVGGLNRMNKSTGTFTRYKHNPANSNSLISNKVSAIFEDSKGNFWVGTAGDGLHSMDRKAGTFQRHRYNPANPQQLSRPPINKIFSQHDHITFITEDASGGLFIGTAESGLNYYNRTTGTLTHYESGKDTAGSFTSRTTWSAYKSHDGVIWISTLEGTLFRINPMSWNIPFTESKFGAVQRFYQEEDGTQWIGLEKGGLLQKKGDGEIKRFLHDPRDPTSIADNTVGEIYTDHQGNFWIGTDQGLDLFNKQMGTFTHHRHDANNTSTLSHNVISVVQEDRNGNLWVGTLRGLNRMNKNRKAFVRYIFYPQDSVYFGPNTITSIIHDSKRQLWVSCAQGGGLHKLDSVSGRFKTYLRGITIVKVYEDMTGTVLAGGNNLYQYDSKADTFYAYVDPVSPVEINNIRSFLEDKQGGLWIGIPDGLLKINRTDSESILYGRNYGVNGNDFVYGSCYKAADGKLFFGHASGFYSFYPQRLTEGMKPPLITLSNFRLANRLVKPDKNGPLPKPLSELNQIILHYKQNVFSIDFAAIDYTNPEDNRHLFMLENYDNDWREASTEHRAYYFNVPPGKYTLRVKGTNGYGLWAERKLEIIITPPWWRTWWAYTIFVLLLITIVWAIIYYKSRGLIKEKKILEAKVNERTSKIVQQKEEIAAQRDNLEQTLDELKSTQSQLVQREKMASLGELTAGIAHEIQNPLNFVNNFSEVNDELLKELKVEADKGNLEEVKAIANDIAFNSEKINHHGKRADAIVKGMLQHSRSSTGQKEPTDINALADEYLRLAYHGLRAKDKSFNANFKTEFDNSIPKINVVPQEIGRVILNLINNAFYAVSEKTKSSMLNAEGYEPTVTVRTSKQKERVEIRIADNGNGIPQKILDKIFQPFFTTKPTGQGTGLGLSLAYDIITKGHNGELKLETKEGEGSEFIIQLPTN
jgi:signal transduction histidine kinase/ligand-binding sensor domain-containing protein